MIRHRQIGPLIVIWACITFGAFNVFTAFLNRSSKPTPQSYTWNGDDFPEFYPLKATRVLIPIEESIHYPISGPHARTLWASDTMPGSGYFRMGPERQAFAVGMAHESHCLRVLRAWLDGDDDLSGQAHYCLGYLRQMILCHPDLTLEDPDVLNRDFEVERLGEVRVCLDWRMLYREMEHNWEDWGEYKAKNLNGSFSRVHD